MHKMNNLEYSTMVKELSGLVGKHFNRIRRIGQSTYRLKIGTTEILCELGIRIHQTMIIESSEMTDKFVEKVGKELDNARLLSLEQVNKDRIVAFNFDKGSLIFEMFGEGNAILVRDGKTVSATKFESWSDREIKAGASYSLPKNVPAERIEPTDRYIIVSLMKLPMGKEYVAEALHRAKIDEKTPGNSLSKEDISRLGHEIEDIKSNPKPCMFVDSGKVVDISLTTLSKYEGMEMREFPTLSAAADAYYPVAERPNPKLEKLMNRLEKQQERLLELREEEKQDKEKGDFIYNKYQDIESVLALAKEGKFGEMKADKKEKSVEADFQ
jgi:predicted ribosome quality control (RQC) complex YloA/Tae2 family protein